MKELTEALYKSKMAELKADNQKKYLKFMYENKHRFIPMQEIAESLNFEIKDIHSSRAVLVRVYGGVFESARRGNTRLLRIAGFVEGKGKTINTTLGKGKAKTAKIKHDRIAKQKAEKASKFERAMKIVEEALRDCILYNTL